MCLCAYVCVSACPYTLALNNILASTNFTSVQQYFLAMAEKRLLFSPIQNEEMLLFIASLILPCDYLLLEFFILCKYIQTCERRDVYFLRILSLI